MKFKDCTGECRRTGCDCGAVTQDGKTIHIPLMLKDGAPATFEDRQRMRDGVKGMTVADAAKLPIYDDVRGHVVSGMDAAEYYALMDGAKPDARGNTGLAARDAAHARQDHARDRYVNQVSNAWRA